MHFFLYEIVARVVAIYLCVDSGRQVWNGLIEGKIANFQSDWVNWLLDWTAREVHRDTAPVSYWIQIGIHVILVACCLVVAIFGWFEPTP